MKKDNLQPENFVFDSPAAIDRSRTNRVYMQENQHLALQFPIESLRHYFHPTFPGRMTLVVAQSHGFKTEWLNFWSRRAAVQLGEQTRRGVIIKISTEDVIESLVESSISAFGGGTMDDISMGIIKDPEAFIRAETVVGGLPVVHIGESMGMDDSNASLLTLSNIARLIDYVRKDHFAEEMPIAGIFADYLQAFPVDKEVAGASNMTDSRTLQMNRDVDTFRRMTKYFACPGVLAAQAPPDEGLSSNKETIKLPGFWDVHWSKYPPQRADFMYSLWLPKLHYPIGNMVSNSAQLPKWNFEVTNSLLWIKALKHKKYQNVGASFPLTILNNGDVEFNRKLYENILKMEKGI